VQVPDIVEAIGRSEGNQIILESSNAHKKSTGSNDVRGRYSIIGLDADTALRLEYRTGSDNINVLCDGERHVVELCGSTIWEYLADFMNTRKLAIDKGLEDSPFWGGFMGYTTYEMGLQGIDVKSKARNCRPSRPDLCFVWITRSVVVDHINGLIYIQELRPTDHPLNWINSIHSKISSNSILYPPTYMSLWNEDADVQNSMTSATSDLFNLPSRSSTNSLSGSRSSTPPSSRTSFVILDRSKSHNHSVQNFFTPIAEDYETIVAKCQSHIRAGSSYELCLTSQSRIQTMPTNPWSLYLTLRARQPAPFASFLRLGAATLISSSPERFLSYSRHGKCELRPMKGTVRKSAEVSTLAQAKQLLNFPKEQAENLMIVDLVRHDLHKICGSGNVQVPKKMVVEEYESVFQMISIVQGQIPQQQLGRNTYTGLDVLAASLPPGSMTGAPKKRSCELLQEIEDEKRGLYSGVVGYMDVGGNGDWSVTIRSMFKWDDERWNDEEEEEEVSGPGKNSSVEKDGEKMEVWRIGAGGAVTALSTPEGERKEMLTKLNGTLGGVFGLTA
jgi:para-aminobenzoate synthetase